MRRRIFGMVMVAGTAIATSLVGLGGEARSQHLPTVGQIPETQQQPRQTLIRDPIRQPIPKRPCTASTSSTSSTSVKDELYFGLSKPNGEMVSTSEWQTFLNREVTPRFRDGLTVVDGRGQYLNQRGKLVAESSKLLILIYPSAANRESAIAEIIAAYKKAFIQESVLRVTACVQTTF